jgi:hypothetical protein
MGADDVILYSSLEGFDGVAGQAFSFSPTGEAISAWNGDTLVIYMITKVYDRRLGFQGGMIIPLSTNTEITPDSLYGLAMWSTDGTTLIYGDAEGVWLFDIYHEGEPQLIAGVENGIVPSPLFVSTTGRYVAYTYDRESGNWTTLDRMNGQIYENAIISPDERYMSQIVPATSFSRPDIGCSAPLIDGCRLVYNDTPPRYFEWIGDDGKYFSVICSDDTNEDCNLKVWDISYSYTTGWERRDYFDYNGYLADVDYEPEQQIFAIVTGTQTIAIAGGEYTIRNSTYDLSEQLAGDIVDVEWMPSLFYRE